MPIGTVKFFNPDKGFGFIAPDEGGNDTFVHISAVEAAGLRTLNQNQRVSYELTPDKRGKMAAGICKPFDGKSWRARGIGSASFLQGDANVPRIVFPRPPKPKPTTMPPLPTWIWRHDPNKTASGKAGTLHGKLGEAAFAQCIGNARSATPRSLVARIETEKIAKPSDRLPIARE